MNKKRKFLIGTAVLIVVLVVAAVTAVAAGKYGSKDDPLVTLSYIDSVEDDINSQLTKSINTAKSDLNTSFDTALSNYKTQVNNAISSSANNAEASVFVLVEIESGKSVELGSGVEFLLRTGTAKLSLESGAVVMNTTSGAVCTDGDSISANNMYVTASGGVSITADTAATVLIRGQYSTSGTLVLSESAEPSAVSEEAPSDAPSEAPSEEPSEEPSAAPSEEPSAAPSEEPSAEPTDTGTQE